MTKDNKNVFVVLGKDPNHKKIRVDKIKDSLFKKNPQTTLVHFFAEELSLSEVSREIDNVFFTKRIFIFKSVQNLPDEVKSYLLEMIKEGHSNDAFIFDFDAKTKDWYKLQKDDFFSFLFELYPPFKVAGRQKDVSLKDLAYALRGNSLKSSLEVISLLFCKYPKEKISMQMLGLMIKIFTDTRSPSLRKRYLRYLFQTDRLVKEGVLDSQRALEFLVLKVNYSK